MYASYRLGNLILKSDTLNIDPSVGIHWLEKLAEMDYPPAWIKLGQQYIKDELIEPNIDKALFYLEKSAKENNSFAYYELARIYLYGIGVGKEESLGMEYLLHSIRIGNEYAEQRSKTRRKKIALGHAKDDELSMKH